MTEFTSLADFAHFAQFRAELVMDAQKEHGVIEPDIWNRVYLNKSPNEKDCAFCRAKAECPSYQTAINAAVGADFSVVIEPAVATVVLDLAGDPDEVLNAKMNNADLAEAWAKAVRAEVERRALAGAAFADWGLELGRKGARQWADPEAVEQTLRQVMRLPVEIAYDLSLISPTTFFDRVVQAVDKHGNPRVRPKHVEMVQAMVKQADPKPSVKPRAKIKSPYTVGNLADDFSPLEDLT